MESYEIEAINSVILRASRTRNRDAMEVLPFRCSVLKKDCVLGDDAYVFIRVRYRFNGTSDTIILSDKAIDVLADLVRFGPRVVYDGYAWSRRSRVVRVNKVEDLLQCAFCKGKARTHFFCKFDDLQRYGKSHYESFRCCAQCFITYLKMILESEKVQECEYPQYEARDEYAAIRR